MYPVSDFWQTSSCSKRCGRSCIRVSSPTQHCTTLGVSWARVMIFTHALSMLLNRLASCGQRSTTAVQRNTGGGSCFFSHTRIQRMGSRFNSGDSSVVESRTHDQKVTGSIPSGSIFFSRANFLCWLLFQYPIYHRVTTAACKRSQSFCQKCRWQITAKHTCTLHLWLQIKWHCKLESGCMVHTEHAQRQKQLDTAPAM